MSSPVALAGRRDRAARQANLERQIVQALDEAQTWYQADKLGEAVSAVKRAEGLLASGGAGDELQQRIKNRRADLETAVQLEKIRLDLAVDFSHKVMSSIANREYGACFQKYGIDTEKLSTDKSAELIRNSPIKRELIAALDVWGGIGAENPADPSKVLPNTKVLQIAMLADPDPWRNGVRDAVRQDDAEAIIKLAAEQGIAIQPPEAELLLAGALRSRNRFQEAIALLRPAQQAYPNNLWINLGVADCMRLIRPPMAEEGIGFERAALALRPESPAVHNHLGAALADHRDYAEAEAAFRAAIKLNPNYMLGYINLSEALRRERKFAEAETIGRAAIRVDPDNPMGHWHLGRALSDQGRNSEAVLEYRATIRLKPDLDEAYWDLGLTLLREDELKEAEVLAREAIRIMPDNALGHMSLGISLKEQGRNAEAEAAYREAIHRKPDDAVAQWSLGAALRDQGKSDDAVAAYREAIRLKPDFAAAYCDLGGVLQHLKEYEEAEAACRESIRLTPNIGA